MKLSALVLDYDGTIATGGAFDPGVRAAVGEARRLGIAVLLVTGRQLEDLRHAAGDLSCFDAVVAENGAVLDFPGTGRHVRLGHPPSPAFVRVLERRAIPFQVGEVVLETDAQWAGPVLDAIRELEQPLILAFNRGRLMVLPQSMGKSIGLRRVLAALRLSIHNTVAVGDAENDHDLLDACEVGVAVAWGSAALRAVADEIVEGAGPPAVADYLRRVMVQPRLAARQMGRRRLMLGWESDGRELGLAVRGRTILIAGEPGTGKSWLAGLLCEQSILQGYSLCVIDPEGDYRSLEALPGVMVLGGDDPPPQTRELERAFRYPDVSVIVDLSRRSLRDKREYLASLLPRLAAMRRSTGLPHKIVLDEAHYFLGSRDAVRLLDPELAGYILVTYRISNLPPSLRAASDVVVLVTRETDEAEIESLGAWCRPSGCVPPDLFKHLRPFEAALLPGAEEARGDVVRFKLVPRLTAHVRHQSKYLDMPVPDSQAFVFTGAGGRPGARARTLKEFCGLLASVPPCDLMGHLHRHDFSRWIADVFRDHPLANHLRSIEARADFDDPGDLTDGVTQAVRARYETTEDATVPPVSAVAGP